MVAVTAGAKAEKITPQFTSIGGQAVIEGVMMRSPRFIAVAVRRPNGRILVRHYPYESVSARYPVLKKPVLRGVALLLESMLQGVDALSFSANVAAEEEAHGELKGKLGQEIKAELKALDPNPAAHANGQAKNHEESSELSQWAMIGSIVTALALGMGLFVVLPHFLTALITGRSGSGITIQSPLFHLLDGALKMAILLTYVYAISLMKDIHRVFQYHGAEHKSIYAFEAGEELTVENARRHTTLHPRCGTSFLLFLVLISIGVFSIVFPLTHLTELSVNPVINHGAMILVKLALMMPVAGLAYEFIKMCACRMDNAFFRAIIWPGLVLQNLTTREPVAEVPGGPSRIRRVVN
jgi:uncharacterized protein YqhQ